MFPQIELHEALCVRGVRHHGPDLAVGVARLPLRPRAAASIGGSDGHLQRIPGASGLSRSLLKKRESGSDVETLGNLALRVNRALTLTA